MHSSDIEHMKSVLGVGEHTVDWEKRTTYAKMLKLTYKVESEMIASSYLFSFTDKCLNIC